MQRKFQPTLGATILMLAMFAVLMALGTWQVQRMEWKNALLRQVAERMAEKPVPLPEKVDNAETWEYRRVTLAGRFLHDRPFLIKPRTLDGANGYHMIVPFQRASGGVVFVNRGWVSDALMPKITKPEGLIQIEGIVQLPSPTRFTPQNVPAKNDWYWADVDAMARAAGLKASRVVVAMSERKAGVYPMGGKVELGIRNDHRQYAIFWYTMGLVLQAVFFISFWKRV